MSITDGTYICGRCGEWMTSCNLCATMESHMVVGPEHITQSAKHRAYDREEELQDRAMRREADIRQGWRV